METITLKIQSKHFQFFLELIQKFNFVEIVKKEEIKDEFVPRTAEQLEADLRGAMQQVKLARAGKIKLKTLQEVLNELPD
jgi:hypothetical protein